MFFVPSKKFLGSQIKNVSSLRACFDLYSGQTVLVVHFVVDSLTMFVA